MLPRSSTDDLMHELQRERLRSHPFRSAFLQRTTRLDGAQQPRSDRITRAHKNCAARASVLGAITKPFFDGDDDEFR
jgi:hypothetical protein